jgi:hypothetical protein
MPTARTAGINQKVEFRGGGLHGEFRAMQIGGQ